jgi:RNA polymerase-binding transcription factor DksA
MVTQQSPMVRSVELADALDRLVDERRRLSRLIDRLRASQPDASGGAVAPPFAGVSRHPADQASDTFTSEATATLLGDVELELRDVDRALRKVAAGAYGRCERCHEPIAADRLAAMPAARFCVRDEERYELGDAPFSGPTDRAPVRGPAGGPRTLDAWAGATDVDGEPADEPAAEDTALTVRELLDPGPDGDEVDILSAVGQWASG